MLHPLIHTDLRPSFLRTPLFRWLSPSSSPSLSPSPFLSFILCYFCDALISAQCAFINIHHSPWDPRSQGQEARYRDESERERERHGLPSFLPFRGTDLQLASIFSKCPYCPLSVPLSSPRDLSRVTTSNEGLSYTVY